MRRSREGCVVGGAQPRQKQGRGQGSNILFRGTLHSMYTQILCKLCVQAFSLRCSA